MDRDEAKAYIKEQMANYLFNKGLDTSKPFKCLNPDHNDRKPSMSFNKETHRAKCFSCDSSYDIFDLIGIDYGLDTYTEQFKKACELYNINNSNNLTKPNTQTPIKKNAPAKQVEQTNTANADYIKGCHAKVDQTDYFTARGISPKTIDRFNLGYDPNHYNGSSIIIPTSEESYVARAIRPKNDDERYRKSKGGNHFLNFQTLQKDEPCFITEGEFDALSVIEAGAEALSLGSVSNVNKLIELFKKNPPSNTFIICLDNDKRGKVAAEELAAGLDELNILFLKANISGKYKDPNEALLIEKDAFIQRVNQAKQEAANKIEELKEAQQEEYKKNSAKNYIDAFMSGIAESVNTPSIKTGFEALDGALDGGLYEGLYVFGAISSLGKTTFVLQIADQIAQSGQDVLIFSLEMARSELISKTISRHTFQLSKDKHKAKTSRGITDGKRYARYSKEENQLINNSLTAYAEYADHLYIFEGLASYGIAEIKAAVEKHMRITGSKPIVIIDYLQIIEPADMRASDKQNTDKAVKELKILSRENKIPVLAISSFNRQNYSQPVSMESFKESGAIEYSSDVLIGLQLKGVEEHTDKKNKFDVNAAKRKDPRQIELKILKNRNGRTGGKLPFDYYPMFNYFVENDSLDFLPDNKETRL